MCVYACRLSRNITRPSALRVTDKITRISVGLYLCLVGKHNIMNIRRRISHLTGADDDKLTPYE